MLVHHEHEQRCIEHQRQRTRLLSFAFPHSNPRSLTLATPHRKLATDNWLHPTKATPCQLLKASRVRKYPGARQGCRRKPPALTPVGCRPRLASLTTQPPFAPETGQRGRGPRVVAWPATLKIRLTDGQQHTAPGSGWKTRAPKRSARCHRANHRPAHSPPCLCGSVPL
jgi:hypothetical protein